MLLQRNIVKKYLNLLSEEQIAKPWAQYTSYFLNEDIQANIQKILTFIGKSIDIEQG